MAGEPPPVSELVRVAVKLQREIEAIGLPFCVIGGLAVQRWGEPRMTRDVDGMVFTNFVDEPALVERLLGVFDSRHPDAASFALQARVLLMVDPERQTGVDLALGAFEYDRGAAERSSEGEFAPDVWVRTCSAEDLIVYKAFANRDLDWNDIRGVMVRQKGRLDLDVVEQELPLLAELKEEPEIMDRWRGMVERYA